MEEDNILANEPKITINGLALKPAEALSVRLAVDQWACQLATDPEALGTDEHARTLHGNYLRLLRNVLGHMMQPL
jgi:hypothetical protein